MSAHFAYLDESNQGDSGGDTTVHDPFFQVTGEIVFTLRNAADDVFCVLEWLRACVLMRRIAEEVCPYRAQKALNCLPLIGGPRAPVAMAEFGEQDVRREEKIAVTGVTIVEITAAKEFANAWQEMPKIPLITPDQERIFRILAEILRSQFTERFRVNLCFIFKSVAVHARVGEFAQLVSAECGVKTVYRIPDRRAVEHRWNYPRADRDQIAGPVIEIHEISSTATIESAAMRVCAGF